MQQIAGLGKNSLPSLSPDKQFVGDSAFDKESNAGIVMPPDYSQSIVNQNIENDSENIDFSIAKLKDDLNNPLQQQSQQFQNRLLSQKTDNQSDYQPGLSLEQKNEIKVQNETALRMKSSDRKDLFNNAGTPMQ